MPKRRLRAALDEPMGCAPLPERDGIVEGRAARDAPTGLLDIGASIEQSVQDRHVVAAGGPVQWGLTMLFRVRMENGGAGIRTRRNECRYRPRGVGEVPRPVRHDMQERP